MSPAARKKSAPTGVSRWRHLAGALALLAVGPLSAQSLYKWESFENRVDSAKSVAALGTDLFGDQISLQTGRLSFSTTDVEIPGNNALPVRFTRSYQVANSKGWNTDQMLADWTVEVPRISGRFAPDWVVSGSANRCSNTTGLPTISPAAYAPYFSVSDFWQGLRIDIPGAASGELLVSGATITKPTDGATYRWTTGDGQVHLSCLALSSPASNTTGEGFLAVTPDGMKYWFQWMGQRTGPSLRERLYDSAGGATQTLIVPTKENTLYATRVEDRFGNYVNYTYSNTATTPGRLTVIESSDGRRIDIEYQSDRIWKVKAGSTAAPATRIWQYGYGVDNSPSASPILASVTLPDASAWSIQFAALSYSPITYMPEAVGEPGEDGQGPPARSCLEAPLPDNGIWPFNAPAPTALTGTLVHPSGASATFSLGLEQHGRTNVTLDCTNVTTTPSNATPGTGNILKDDQAVFPFVWYDWTLTSKQITGPGLPTLSWAYEYDSPYSFVIRGPNASGSYPRCTLTPQSDCYQPTCQSDSCAGRSTTLVSLPDGNKERYTFGNSWQYDEGKLLKVERGYVSPTSRMEMVTHTYDLSRANQAYLARFGTSLRLNVDGFPTEFHRPALSKVTTRDGASFTWAVADDAALCGSVKCYDALARPKKVSKSSTLGFSKTETYAYSDHLSKWVMGQLSGTQVDSTTVASAIYDPTYATMTQFSAFGQVQQYIGYDTTSTVASGLRGTVSSVTDANSKITTLTNWYRGVPQTLGYPTGVNESAVANAFGWITSTTDELGNTTCYGHDLAGRVNLITYPSETTSGVCDTSTWASTSITFTKVPTAEYAIPAQHWRRTETTGARARDTYYDALWRPILDRQRTTDSSASERFVRKDFDYAGRETLTAYPVASVSDYTTVTTGIDTGYDALGRITGTTSDSELGVLTTSTTYGIPFTSTHTNARFQATTTTFQAFDEPTYDAPLQIAGPEGITSTYARDVYGKPTSLTRSGNWLNPNTGGYEAQNVARQFLYDAQQRLCKALEPDAGITVLDYDAAGNLAWRAAGQATLTLTNDCQRTSVPTTERSTYHYDALNRLLAVDHPVSTDDLGYTHFGDGAMQTASVGTLSSTNPVTFSTTRNSWTYTYSRRRLLETESLALDGKTFLLDPAYNNRGDLDTLAYPSGGHSVSFNPNAYGEPRQVGAYATGATYQPNGQFAGFTYGNSTVRTVTPNTRQLPGQIADVRFGTPLLNHTLGYDANGNLSSLTDNVSGALETRTMAYDGRDRLTTVTANSGNESYAYDALDNLRRTVRGSVDQRYHLYPTTQRLSQITTVGSPVIVDYLWNDRGELSSRNTTFPGNPSFTSPTIWRNGFEENTITTQEPTTFDRAGRLTTFSGTFTHQYDAHGRRVASVVPMWGTRYQVYDRQGELRYVEDAGKAERVEFFSLNGTLVAQRSRPLTAETATVSYLHSDHRGTPSVKSAAGGTVDYRSRLMPYGAPYDGIWRDGPGFTKHAMDEIGNLVYMQQRYYDPAGVFLSPDPIGSTAQSFNRYWYANANPYTFVDPDGRQACTGSRLTCPSQTISIGGAIPGRSKSQANTAFEVPQLPSATPAASVPEKSFGDSLQRGAGKAWDEFANKILPALGPPEALISGGAKIAGAGIMAVRLGNAGENAVRSVYAIGSREFIWVNGRLRIPDGINKAAMTVNEVKNVSYQAYTRQLRDYVDFARSRGMTFNLFVRPGAQISGPLEAARNAGQLTIREIPFP